MKITIRSKSIRDLNGHINGFKNGYQPRTNIVRDEKGDLVADPYSILAWWRNCFSQPLNVHEVKDVRHIEIRKAESLVHEVELPIGKLKSHKSPGIDQIQTELRNEVQQLPMRSINLLFLFGIRRNCLRTGRSQS